MFFAETLGAPDGTFEIFGYNEADHTLESHLRRDGVTVTYDYDAANRIGARL